MNRPARSSILAVGLLSVFMSLVTTPTRAESRIKPIATHTSVDDFQFTEIVPVDIPLPCGGASQCVIHDNNACSSDEACKRWAMGFAYYQTYMYMSSQWGSVCIAFTEVPNWLRWGKYTAIILAGC